ncbi:pyridoxal-phosphate dependent enzyme, partial [Planctomycetota bacterium]
KYDGNLFLDAILGADIRFVEPGGNRNEVVDQVTEEYKAKGHNPYVVSVGGSSVGRSMTEPIGALSYTKAFLETYKQARTSGIKINHLVHATGSGGTQSGLVVGAKAVDPDVKIVGISVGGAKAGGQKSVSTISNQLAEVLRLSLNVAPEEVIIFDEYVGEGYGILNQQIADALQLMAHKEGILLDPVYTGKAMAGLIDLIKKGYFKKDDNVIFMHTGGTPALFAYKEQLLELMKDVY